MMDKQLYIVSYEDGENDSFLFFGDKVGLLSHLRSSEGGDFTSAITSYSGVIQIEWANDICQDFELTASPIKSVEVGSNFTASLPEFAHAVLTEQQGIAA